ncbi:MAG: DUF2442 domain-containing protein [Oceanicaulis sp.]
MLIKVLNCRPLDCAKLSLNFSDGSSGVVDLSDTLTREGAMVAPLRDPDYFKRVFLEAGGPTWPNGFDLAPWALHTELKAAGGLEPAAQRA